MIILLTLCLPLPLFSGGGGTNIIISIIMTSKENWIVAPFSLMLARAFARVYILFLL